ncbi:hypothetical protein PAPYR_109 [Paratrimastix pyriformis]|uniref:Uncharacterized protein n=1 Tax=Paratrimastix pyriformis TaxID=342808 RepID=A0ABQ8UUW0_9EUKA|nr:hypothetical protein PAPYR_109 [Paratrimastix pyriformis]
MEIRPPLPGTSHKFSVVADHGELRLTLLQFVRERPASRERVRVAIQGRSFSGFSHLDHLNNPSMSPHLLFDPPLIPHINTLCALNRASTAAQCHSPSQPLSSNTPHLGK